MKKKALKKKYILILIMIAAAVIAGIVLYHLYSQTQTSYVTREFQDTSDLLKNPGKGLVVQGWCNPDYEDAYYEMCSVDYERFEWAAIEPEEGNYCWYIIDEYIEEAAARGLKFAFGVMNVNTSSDTIYVTPKWVFDAGAEGTLCTTEDIYAGTHTICCPCWTDEIFLEKVNNFVKALGERYDGNENIAYIDIRSYGNWGEQHLTGLESSGYSDITAEQLKEDYIIPYQKAFPNTLLVNACNDKLYAEVYDWAVDEGMAVRRDGIMGFSDGGECARAYGKVPAIYEFGHDLEYYREHDMWNMEEIAEDLEIGMPSYLEFHHDFYSISADDFAQFANRIGYYFRLKQAVYPERVANGEDWRITLIFRNDGVAPLYENAIMKIGFFDEKKQLVDVVTTKGNPQNWEPGTQTVYSLAFSSGELEEGTYTAAVGLFLNEDDLQPDYLLGSEGNDGNNWYVIGTIQIMK